MVRQGKLSWLAHDLTHRGVTAWLLTAILFVFSFSLYFTERLTPVAQRMGLESKWTLYGLLYSLAIVIGGIFVIRKYRHNKYQIVRTSVVMFVQVVLAFAIPHMLKFFHQPEFYFSYLWPLKFEYFVPGIIFKYPAPFILYSFLGSLIMVPVLGIFFGKRWYCSWVCGCGGLANTAGDPLRHLTSKSSASWKFEKIAVHTVLGLCVALTALLFITWAIGDRYAALSQFTNKFQTLYGFIVVAMLSGIIGAAIYPIGGTRFWCRNFCPMAAVLGLVQKFGRFRITVKDNMCISCGLCSKYCEMGIDVRSYAQANTSFTRASCVGCGLCAEVCPRGVLRLENVTRRDPQEIALVQISGIKPTNRVAI
ncbi:MAG TPA: 4Fe-4S dicluster-binding protein [Candidatus Acidoferrales bacterium]|jgi:polyferredoxin|nr:4Fe-4S dicluster-binding protein [Candidatus Acidoferrales bacterium]